MALIRLSLLCALMVVYQSTVRAQLINADLWKLRKEWGFWQFERANTARFSVYMGRVDKRAILLMNLARQDGAKFTSLVMKPYFDKHPRWDEYYTTLSRKDAPMLMPSFRLWLSALIHTIPSGLIGYEGHQAMGLRMALFGNLSAPSGENCSYGHYRAMLVVSQLLNSSGHRRNILNDEYSRVAVAHFIHVRNGWNSVTTFGGPKFFDLTFRNHNQLKHVQVNASLATNFNRAVLDLGVGLRHFNEVSAARWSLGSEVVFNQGALNFVPKLHAASEFYYVALGANLLVAQQPTGAPNLIVRPEVSFRFPYSVIRKGRGKYYEYMDIERSTSSIGISYGYNIGVLDRSIGPYQPHMLSFTYSKNFGFWKNKNR